MDQGLLQLARQQLGGARRLLVLCGAGLSQEAGLPTFRDAQGLWQHHRPEDLATPEAFARQPGLVWAWYRQRIAAAAQAAPHAGHLALAQLGLRPELELTVVNQNVDGLLERAWQACGADLRQVLAIHGSLAQAHCSRCGQAIHSADLPAGDLPSCRCGGLLRPSVVWFGEGLKVSHMRRMESESQRADLLLVVGTSAQVWPAAGLVPVARQRGVPVVVVNPDPQAAGPGDLSLTGGALEWLPALVEAL